MNATVEVAHQILTLRAFGARAQLRHVVTPTLLAAGTTTNTVPELASLAVDVRAWTSAELERVDRAIHELVPFLPEATLAVEGNIGRHPMTRSVARPLLEMARSGRPVDSACRPCDGAHAAGASDGNFTAALGVPTPRTGWARWVAGRTPATSTSSSTGCRSGRPCWPGWSTSCPRVEWR